VRAPRSRSRSRRAPAERGGALAGYEFVSAVHGALALGVAPVQVRGRGRARMLARSMLALPCTISRSPVFLAGRGGGARR
jgi:hypothetical protein